MRRLGRQQDKLKDAEDFANDRGMTEKERRFCYEYIIDRCISRACKRAEISEASGGKMIKRQRVIDFIEHLEQRDTLANIQSEPVMLKGQRAIWANSNMKDYFDENGFFVGFKNLTDAQASCIRKFKAVPKEHGTEIQIELYDAAHSNELLAKPHGLFDSINIDLSLLDMIDPEDIEALTKKYGWGDDKE